MNAFRAIFSYNGLLISNGKKKIFTVFIPNIYLAWILKLVFQTVGFDWIYNNNNGLNHQQLLEILCGIKLNANQRYIFHKTWSEEPNCQKTLQLHFIIQFSPGAPHPCSYYQNKTSGAPRMINRMKTHYKKPILTEGPMRERIMADVHRRFLYVCVCKFVHACMWLIARWLPCCNKWCEICTNKTHTLMNRGGSACFICTFTFGSPAWTHNSQSFLSVHSPPGLGANDFSCVEAASSL